MRLLTTLLVFLLLAGCSSTSIVKNKLGNLDTQWTIISGSWDIDGDVLKGKHSIDENTRAVILNHQKLPSNYILSFSVSITDGVFYILTHFKDDKFVTVFLDPKSQRLEMGEQIFTTDRSVIKTTNSLSNTPEVSFLKKYNTWMDVKIQKAGKSVFIWIDGEPYLEHKDKQYKVLKKRGTFGFSTLYGEVEIKNLSLIKTTGKMSSPPENFKSQDDMRGFFIFSE